MLPPGVAIFGLILSSLEGPQLENEEMEPPVAVFRVNCPVTTSGNVTVSLGLALRVCPSSCPTNPTEIRITQTSKYLTHLKIEHQGRAVVD